MTAHSQSATKPRLVAGPNQGLFLMLSDIHLDPFADPGIACKLASSPVESWTAIFQSSKNTKYSGYGSDTTYPLFASALEAAKGWKFDHLIVTGDFLRHNFQTAFTSAMAGCPVQDYPGFVAKTMRYMNQKIQDTFRVPVFSALGNNDSTCGDYEVAPNDSFLAALAKDWRSIAAHPNALETLRIGGYYAVPNPNVANQEIVALNDIFWSAKYKDACATSQRDPGPAEMAWLEWTLYRLQSEKKTAVLLMHIPPGMDAFSSSKGQCPSPAVMMWQPAYNDKFLALMQSYRGVVTQTFVGHTHMDDFRVTGEFSAHIAPAITPDFGNNPAFEVGVYNKTDGALTDYAPVYLTNLTQVVGGSAKPVWQTEYVFSGTYGFSISPANLQTLAGRIQTDPAIRTTFENFYAAETAQGSPITAKNWIYYSCAQTQMGAAGYNGCACPAAPH